MSNTAPQPENTGNNSRDRLTRGQRLGRTIVSGLVGVTGWGIASQSVEAVPGPLDVAQAVVPGPESVTPEQAKTLQFGAFEGIKENSDGIVPDNYVVYTVREGDTIDEITRGLPFASDEARELGEKQLFAQGTPDGENAGQLQIGSKIVMLTEQFPELVAAHEQEAGGIVQNPLGYQEISLPPSQG